MEKAIKSRFEEVNSRLLCTDEYQSGFKSNISTHKNLSILINHILSTKKKEKQKKHLYLYRPLKSLQFSEQKNII